MVDVVKHHPMKTYGQFCGLARALDVIGDRWNLLIVRELIAGPLRYTELRTSLAGVATNLLADRLRTLETFGVVERRVAEGGVAYALTPWGEGLRAPLEALVRWSAPLMVTGGEGEVFRPRWLVLALPALLAGVTASPPAVVGVEVAGTVVVVRVDAGGVHAELGAEDDVPDTLLSAPPAMLLGLAAGALGVDEVVAAGHLFGDGDALRRAFPAERRRPVCGPTAADPSA